MKLRPSQVSRVMPSNSAAGGADNRRVVEHLLAYNNEPLRPDRVRFRKTPEL